MKPETHLSRYLDPAVKEAIRKTKEFTKRTGTAMLYLCDGQYVVIGPNTRERDDCVLIGRYTNEVTRHELLADIEATLGKS